ncbi:MAG TPA: 4Fe-4S binding protein [Ktedonobacteraceae bacterium]
MIDLDKCVQCGECKAACFSRHGHLRMNRKGLVVGTSTYYTMDSKGEVP